MFRYTVKQLLKTPVVAIAVLLFAAILALVFCRLEAANTQEELTYQQIYDTIPVTVYISNLTGTSIDNLSAPQWPLDYMYLFLDDYVKDIQAKARLEPGQLRISLQIDEEPLSQPQLTGITSLSAASELSQKTPGFITWVDGYGESILAGNDLYCILPECMVPDDAQLPLDIQAHFEVHRYNTTTNDTDILKLDLILTAVAIHKNDVGIYCPLSVVQSIAHRMEKEIKYDRISGTLTDNSKMAELRSVASKWFADPDLSGENGTLGGNGDIHYSYALKIDDSQLRAAQSAMENSKLINDICSVLIMLLSLAAGFLMGFLVVRNRKKEIALMRTMGTPNRSIYFGFVLEQMLCVVLGIVLGGSYNGWHPADRLGILAVIYFVGLTVALQIFLHKNLLTTIKEDE